MKITLITHRMMFLLFIVFVHLSFFVEKDAKQNSNKELVSIKGTLSGFGDGTKVFVKYDDLLTNELVQHINVTGKNSFQLEFHKYNRQDITLIIGEHSIPILATPGDVIQVSIDRTNVDKPIQFIGEKAKFNNDFYNLFNEISKFNISPDSIKHYLNSNTPEEYKTRIRSYENIVIAFVNTFSKTNEINKEITDWYKTYVQYRAANNLTSPYNYKWKKYNVKPNYWNFLNDSLINNEEALSCSEYMTFACSYYIYLHYVEQKFNTAKKFYEKDWTDYYNILIDSLDATRDGIMIDMLISNMANRFMKVENHSFNNQKTQIYDKIENRRIKKLNIERQRNFYSNLENSKLLEGVNIYDYRNEEKSPDLLRLLTSRYEGKVIYIDNWATWCGPCIAEMPHSVHLQQDYENDEVVFVFLCHPENNNNNRAESIISELKLKGEHYFMNRQLANPTAYIFKRSGVPRYMLINKNGDVADNDAPRPSSNEIRDKLNKLLEK